MHPPHLPEKTQNDEVRRLVRSISRMLGITAFGFLAGLSASLFVVAYVIPAFVPEYTVFRSEADVFK